MTKAENIKKVVSGIESVTARAKQSQRPSHMGQSISDVLTDVDSKADDSEVMK